VSDRGLDAVIATVAPREWMLGKYPIPEGLRLADATDDSGA